MLAGWQFLVGTLESTAAVRLPALLSRYHAFYPDVAVELVTDTSRSFPGMDRPQELSGKTGCACRRYLEDWMRALGVKPGA